MSTKRLSEYDMNIYLLLDLTPIHAHEVSRHAVEKCPVYYWPLQAKWNTHSLLKRLRDFVHFF